MNGADTVATELVAGIMVRLANQILQSIGLSEEWSARHISFLVNSYVPLVYVCMCARARLDKDNYLNFSLCVSLCICMLTTRNMEKGKGVQKWANTQQPTDDDD